jgi:hypothetical protein
MLTLAEGADLRTLYDAEMARYRGTSVEQVVTFERYRALYGHCRSLGFFDDGLPIGGVIFDGEAAHIAVLAAYHGRWGLLLPRAVQWLFTLADEIRVGVEADNERCLRFMARCGWQQVDTDAMGDPVFLMVPPKVAGERASRILREPRHRPRARA